MGKEYLFDIDNDTALVTFESDGGVSKGPLVAFNKELAKDVFGIDIADMLDKSTATVMAESALLS